MKIPKPIVILFCAVPWIAAAGVLVWLLNQRFPLSGELHFSFLLDGRSAWFDPFLPGERVTPYGAQSDGWIGQRIFRDPVYAGIRRPGIFDWVNVTLDARALKQPLIEIGILRNAETFAFETIPVWSEALASGWHRVERGTRRGYVRDGIPDDAIESNDPSTLMVWRASPDFTVTMDPVAPERRYDVTLRGAYDVFAIPSSGAIAFRFLLQDMNRSAAATTTVSNHSAIFRVMRGDELIWSDAVGTGSGRAFEKIVRVEGLKPAVYRVSLIASDDIFTRAISTSASHWVVGPRIVFGDDVGYRDEVRPARAWTNSQHLIVETFHQEGLQTVFLGSANVEMTREHQTYPLDRRMDEMAGARIFSAPRGDVRVVGDGYFAFAENALFLPSPRRLSDASDPAAEGINAIITDYVPPERTDDGWLRLRATFSLPTDDDRPKLMLAAPGVEFRGGAVDVRRVTLDYRRPPMTWELVKPLLWKEGRAIWHRIKNL